MSADGTTLEQIVTPAEMAHADIRWMLAAHRAIASELATLAKAADVRAFEEANRSAEQP